MEQKKLKITLVKSLIATLPKHKAAASALGLRKIGDSVILGDTDATKGLIRVVAHLVKVEDAQ